MTILIRRALGAAALLAIGLPAAPAAAQTVLKWAHVYETSEPYHTCAVAASDALKQATDGRYSIEVYPASSLGKEVDINEGLGLGTVDIIYTGQLFAGSAYGPIAIGGAPFMFRDFHHWDAYRNSDLFKELSDGYADASGNHVVAMTYYGDRHVTSNKPILKPEDMKGLKIRVPNAPLYQMFPLAVGANPTPIAFAEVYLALQQGTVDAQENPLPTIQAKKFYEVQKDINLTAHITDALLTIVGGPAWDAMADGGPAGAVEGRRRHRDLRLRTRSSRRRRNWSQWFKDQGVQVNEVDRGPFIEATRKLHNGDMATWDQADLRPAAGDPVADPASKSAKRGRSPSRPSRPIQRAVRCVRPALFASGPEHPMDAAETAGEPDDKTQTLLNEEKIDLSDLRWEDGLVFVVFWVLAFVVFLQFFTRYVLNNSLGWTEEIARYLLIGVTFIGAVMAVRKTVHIAVEILYRWLSRPLRRAAQTLIDVVAHRLLRRHRLALRQARRPHRPA